MDDCITRQTILDEAAKCVTSDRNAQYGEPEDSFKIIAKFWELYVQEKCASEGANISITSSDVAAMMVLFKVSRVAGGQAKADNWIDIAGYAACGGEVQCGTAESIKRE